MDRNSQEYQLMRDKALAQLRSGESLTGKDGAFGPLLKEFLEAALDGEMSSHLDESERQIGNKRNGRGSKRVKTMAGEIEIVTPQDRHSSFNPEILKKRETILADNLSSKIISLYGMGMSLRDISTHIEEMYDVEISHNTLSEIIDRIVPKVKEWQSRPLENMYTILWLDAMHYKVKDGGRTESRAVYNVLAINKDGRKEFTGMVVEDAKEAITAKLEKMGVAKRTVNYKFREWIFARQRYWGEPVPCVYKEDGSIYFLPDDELPLILPELEDYKGKNGKAPLENATEWKQYDRNGVKGTRETSTMPGSAGSSWYYMRYIDPHNDKEFANQELLKHWMPVDLYVGGPEHAVGHLMYSRIWNRFLFDQGLSPVKEPFKKLVHQGMILGSNGIKMGKRFPEFVVNPSDVVEEYGADTLRLYEMFMGPLEVSKPWNDNNVQGAKRFITRVWNFFTEPENIIEEDDGKLTRIYHQTVKKVTNDFEALGYNTAISQMMIFVNEVYKAGRCPREFAEGLIKMLSCVCPHVGEEIWQRMGHDDTIAFEPWPVYDEAKTVEDTVEIAVQINGKTKGTLAIGKQDPKDEVIAKAKDVIADKLTGNIVKEIYVPGRIVNIVMK
jgi:leucyl-tRNA synthetase family protein